MKARRLLAQGRSVLIFPEGTRKSASEPIEFKRGVELLYTRLNRVVLPVALNSGLFWGPDRPTSGPERFRFPISIRSSQGLQERIHPQGGAASRNREKTILAAGSLRLTVVQSDNTYGCRTCQRSAASIGSRLGDQFDEGLEAGIGQRKFLAPEKHRHILPTGEARGQLAADREGFSCLHMAPRAHQDGRSRQVRSAWLQPFASGHVKATAEDYSRYHRAWQHKLDCGPCSEALHPAVNRHTRPDDHLLLLGERRLRRLIRLLSSLGAGRSLRRLNIGNQRPFARPSTAR